MRLVELFGKRVREVRHERGWRQEQLAFEAGVKRAYLSEVENGQRNVSLDVVERLASTLEISANSLLLEP